MKPFFKKIGLFILAAIRPLFLAVKARYPNAFSRMQAELTEPYQSGMVTQFSLPHELVFKPYFEKVRTHSEELSQLRELSAKGTLVYVMKNRGQLEYSFFNHLFLKEGIPLAYYANGSRTLFWRPFGQIIRLLIARLDRYYETGLLEDAIASGYLERLVSSGKSVLLNLKVSRELIFGTTEDAFEFIPPLLKAAQKSKRPVYLVTQQFLYDLHPEKSEKSLMDLLFGEKSNPGMFRKLILFLMSYRRKASVKFGDALDLKQFLLENPNDDLEDLAGKLNNILLNRLRIERKSITGPVLKPKARFLEKILRNKSFKEDLEKLQAGSGKTKAEIQKDVQRYFEEIAAEVNYSYIDLYDRLVHWISTKVFDGLDLDPEELARIKAVAGKHPIVLAPAHKSHIDYLLLSYIFYNHDLTLPHICAGINLKFWPVAGLIRKAGGFFIRRGFDGNRVYKLVLEHYLRMLMQEGYSMEFFIEGTRSRTGKLLKPKMGILSMLFKSYMDGSIPDIYFVPLSINYERILEEKSYLSESRGSAKQKENVAGILKAGKTFRKKYGKVFVRFSDPISLKGFLKESGIEPGDAQKADYRKEVEEFAYRLTYQINRVSVVTSTALVSTALLTKTPKALTKDDLLERIDILQHYLEYKGADMSTLIVHEGDKAYLDALGRLANDHIIEAHDDFQERFYTVSDDRRAVLDYNKNNSIHFFVSLVSVSKILKANGPGELPLDALVKRYETFKQLLRHDFTFSERASLTDHVMRVIRFYVQENLVKYDEAKRAVRVPESTPGDAAFNLYASILDNFFEGFYFTLLYIKNVPFEKIERKRLESDIAEKGKLFYLKGELSYPEALSQFNVRNALLVFEDLGLVRRDGADLASRVYDEDTIRSWEKILAGILGVESGRRAPDDEKKMFESSPVPEGAGLQN